MKKTRKTKTKHLSFLYYLFSPLVRTGYAVIHQPIKEENTLMSQPLMAM